jgi:hypothetical protein
VTGDAAQSRLHELVRELVDGGGAERRVAAAAQDEVAGDRPARVRERRGQDRGRQAALGAVAQQRGGGRVELLDRGGHARDVGAVGEQRRVRAQVHDVGARVGTGARHLASQDGLRGGRPGGPRGGRRQQGDQDGEEDGEARHRRSSLCNPTGARKSRRFRLTFA